MTYDHNYITHQEHEFRKTRFTCVVNLWWRGEVQNLTIYKIWLPFSGGCSFRSLWELRYHCSWLSDGIRHNEMPVWQKHACGSALHSYSRKRSWKIVLLEKCRDQRNLLMFCIFFKHKESEHKRPPSLCKEKKFFHTQKLSYFFLGSCVWEIFTSLPCSRQCSLEEHVETTGSQS